MHRWTAQYEDTVSVASCGRCKPNHFAQRGRVPRRMLSALIALAISYMEEETYGCSKIVLIVRNGI
jgi:hypothetical protein